MLERIPVFFWLFYTRISGDDGFDDDDDVDGDSDSDSEGRHIIMIMTMVGGDWW